MTVRRTLFVRVIAFSLAVTAASGCAPFQQSRGPITYVEDHGQPTIVCLGDSLTQGIGAPASKSYPAWLQRKLLDERFSYRVVNAGVSGDRVADGAARLQHDVYSFRPKIAIVELGSNDPGRTSSPRWRSQLNALIRDLQSHRVEVLLAGLDEPGMNTLYREVAGQRQVPLVWITSQLWSRPGLWGDAHHPNGEGYRVVMETVWPKLRPMLRRI